MKIAIINKKGEKIEELALCQAFDYKVSKELLALYVNYLRNATRDPIANSKDRGEVSGGGKKPYKQKGTGNARAGSTRSPLWVGGGVTFGPSSDQNWRNRITKRMKKQVIAGIIGSAISEKKVIGLDNLSFKMPKTSDAVKVLDDMKIDSKTSVIYSETDENAEKSFRNIAGIVSMDVNKINLIDFMSSKKAIITKDALTKLNERYSKER